MRMLRPRRACRPWSAGPAQRWSGRTRHEDLHGGGGQSHRHTTLGARVIDCVADQFMRDQHRAFDPHRRGQRRHRHPRGPHSTADRPVRDGSSLHAGARARDARNCRRSRSRSARWGSANKPSRPSTIEHRPANLVSQPLILQDEFANRIRELFPLPTALEPTGALTLTSGGRSTRGLDRVGRSTELVRRDVRYHCRLAGSICGVPSGSTQLPCRRHSMTTCRTGLRHPDLAVRPCPNLLDRLTGPRVQGLFRLEQVQNVLCTRRRPQSQEPMVGIRERPPAADRDEARIAGFGEDHGCTLPGCICPTYLSSTARYRVPLPRPGRLPRRVGVPPGPAPPHLGTTSASKIHRRASFARRKLRIRGSDRAGEAGPVAGPGYDSLATPLAFGLSLLIVVASIGHISGAHVNPAVTLRLAATGDSPGATFPHI
jgi:hypothetical protein